MVMVLNQVLHTGSDLSTTRQEATEEGFPWLSDLSIFSIFCIMCSTSSTKHVYTARRLGETRPTCY